MTGQEWQKNSVLRHRSLVKRLHLSIIASLGFILMFSLVARHVDLDETVFSTLTPQDIEFLQIQLIKNLPKPPAAKTTKVLPPIHKIEEAEPIPEKVTTKIKPVTPNKNRREVADIKFSLDDVPANLTSNSSMDYLGDARVDRDRDSMLDDMPELRTEFDDSRLVTDAASIDVNLDDVGQRNNRDTETPGLTINEPKIEKQKREPVEKTEALITDDVSVVLTSSDMNIGLKEYPLWNRLNAEFSRWDKGRYGSFPDHLKRRGRTITAQVGFADGTAHQIVWNRGATRIYVQGNSTRSRIDEIKQAVSAIVRLNVRKTRS